MPNSDKVYELMDAQGITQAELARRSGLCRTHLNHILKRNQGATEITIAKLCKGLKCKPEDIMLEVGDE